VLALRGGHRSGAGVSDRLPRLLGLELPIVLAPFGGLSSVELTATVSNAGGLGSYGLYGYTPDRIRDTFTGLRAATSRPFALNLWLPTGTERDPLPKEYAHARAAAAEFFTELDLPLPDPPARYLPSFEEQIDTALELTPAALSFVYGVPPAHLIARARDRGTIAGIGQALHDIGRCHAVGDRVVDAQDDPHRARRQARNHEQLPEWPVPFERDGHQGAAQLLKRGEVRRRSDESHVVLEVRRHGRPAMTAASRPRHHAQCRQSSDSGRDRCSQRPEIRSGFANESLGRQQSGHEKHVHLSGVVQYEIRLVRRFQKSAGMRAVIPRDSHSDGSSAPRSEQ
jgi:hypothetical protein